MTSFVKYFMYVSLSCVINLFVHRFIVRLWHECPSTLWDQRPQSLRPRPYGEEREDPPDHQRRVRGCLCHRWDDQLHSGKVDSKTEHIPQVMKDFTPSVLSLQCGRLVTWCPWIPTACRTPMLNSNWFQTPRATASRRPRPSAQHSILCGMRVSLCEFLNLCGKFARVTVI